MTRPAAPQSVIWLSRNTLRDQWTNALALLQSECKTTSVIYTKPTNACRLIILEFREAFKIFDVDNSQTITTDELLLVMKNLGMMATKDEVKDMLSEVDEDGMLPGNEKGWGVG